MWLFLSLCPQYVFDYRPGDIYACVADIGWITGHSYVVYGPLCNGATTVLFESHPAYPDPGKVYSEVRKSAVCIRNVNQPKTVCRELLLL